MPAHIRLRACAVVIAFALFAALAAKLISSPFIAGMVVGYFGAVSLLAALEILRRGGVL